MREGCLTLVGLFVLAALAWAAPPVLHHLRERRSAPLPPILYREGPAGALVWSPAASAPNPSFSLPTSLPGGWQGVLLGQPLDLNAATLEDLEALPLVGPKTAAALLAARRELGGFQTVDDLLAVPGLGPKTLEKLRPLVRVRGAEGRAVPAHSSK